MNDTSMELVEQEATLLNVLVPQMRKKLSLRARLCYAKLQRLSRPESARGLSRLFGGLSIGERTVSAALKSLLKAGLVTHSKDGWTAKPPHDNRDAFDWASGGRHPYYFSIVTPLTNPFPGQKNAVEMLAVYFCCAYGRRKNNTDIADKTGISRKAVGLIVHKLVAMGLLDNADDKNVLPQTWQNAVYSPDDEPAQRTRKPAKPVASETVPTSRPVLSVLIGELQKESEILLLVKKLLDAGMSMEKAIIPDIRKALALNAANLNKGVTYGDGSGIVISFLNRLLENATGHQRRQAEYTKVRNAQADREREYREQRDREDAERAKLESGLRSKVAVEDRVNRTCEVSQVLKAARLSALTASTNALEGFKELTLDQLTQVLADPLFAKTLKATTVTETTHALVQRTAPSLDKSSVVSQTTHRVELPPADDEILAALSAWNDIPDDKPKFLGDNDA